MLIIVRHRSVCIVPEKMVLICVYTVMVCAQALAKRKPGSGALRKGLEEVREAVASGDGAHVLPWAPSMICSVNIYLPVNALEYEPCNVNPLRYSPSQDKRQGPLVF